MWYVIYTKPHKSDYVEMNLSHLGIEVYNPKYQTKRIIRRRPQVVTKQLFPNYMFARFSLAENYRKVKYARGVVKIVGNSDTPIPVDNEIIETIKSYQNGGYVVINKPEFKVGEKVEIHNGPFAGFKGIFEREMKDRERVMILLDAISYSARVEVHRESVRRAE